MLGACFCADIISQLSVQSAFATILCRAAPPCLVIVAACLSSPLFPFSLLGGGPMGCGGGLHTLHRGVTGLGTINTIKQVVLDTFRT